MAPQAFPGCCQSPARIMAAPCGTGPVGGAAWDDDVDWNEGVNVPGQKLNGRGN